MTVDIDKRLKPDIVASILELPIKTGTFDVVCAFELLEHLPFADYLPALRELHRVSARYVAVSLPDASRCFPLYLKIPRYGIYKKLIPVFRLRPPEHKFDGEHYWEIGKQGYPLAKIVEGMNRANFDLVKTYQVFEFPYHRFFLLAKRS